MKITIIRHGKPNIAALGWQTAAAFGQSILAYDEAGLSASSTPSPSTLTGIEDCSLILCSQLPRSIDSAKALASHQTTLSDPVFNEAGLPHAHWGGLKLSPWFWAVFFRLLWFMNYGHNSETLKDAKIRAKAAAQLLAELATKHGSVALVGHGIFNRLLAHELRNAGWVGPKNPGTQHWRFGIYEKPAPQE